MTRYIVTYDLSKPGRDYPELYKRIKSYSWTQITESTYAVVSDKTSKEIWDHLEGALDGNDTLLVGPLGRPCSWIGLAAKASEWLKGNPP